MTSNTEGITSYSFIVVLGAICALAVFSNILILLVIALSKHFRGVTEMFIGNLAVSDLILAGLAIPLKLHQAASGSHDFLGGKKIYFNSKSLKSVKVCQY